MSSTVIVMSCLIFRDCLKISCIYLSSQCTTFLVHDGMLKAPSAPYWAIRDPWQIDGAAPDLGKFQLLHLRTLLRTKKKQTNKKKQKNNQKKTVACISSAIHVVQLQGVEQSTHGGWGRLRFFTPLKDIKVCPANIIFTKLFFFLLGKASMNKCLAHNLYPIKK